MNFVRKVASGAGSAVVTVSGQVAGAVKGLFSSPSNPGPRRPVNRMEKYTVFTRIKEEKGLATMGFNWEHLESALNELQELRLASDISSRSRRLYVLRLLCCLVEIAHSEKKLNETDIEPSSLLQALNFPVDERPIKLVQYIQDFIWAMKKSNPPLTFLFDYHKNMIGAIDFWFTNAQDNSYNAPKPVKFPPVITNTAEPAFIRAGTLLDTK
jgi:hypothetical protein